MRVKQSGFLNQADSLAINISHGGNEVNFFQNRPRENGTKIDPPPKIVSQTDASLTVDDPVEPSGSQSGFENVRYILCSLHMYSSLTQTTSRYRLEKLMQFG